MEATLEVETREALAALFYPNGRSGGLTVPGAAPGPLGATVTLLIKTRSPHRQFRLRGQLAWVRHKGSAHHPAAFGFDISPDDEAMRVRVLAFARAELPLKFTRIEDRQQVELEVKLLHEGMQRREWLADLSTRGAFVRTWNPLPVGSQVQMKLRPRLALRAMEMQAQVAWVRLAGEPVGMGLEFIEDESMRARLSKFLSSLVR